MYKRLIFMGVVLVFMVSACASAETTPTPSSELPSQQLTQPAPPGQPRVLRVMTHDSFAVSEEVINAFMAENNIDVQFILSGDTGSALNRAIISKGNPIADVFYGVDNTFLSRALEEEIFEPYNSPMLEKIDPEFKLDPSNHALPVDFGDVCLNYDRAYFEVNSITPPQSLEDLVKPEYRSLLVVQNPATSSPGLAFMLATIGHFGEEGYLDYWRALRENDVLVVNSWDTAYNTEFSGSAGQGSRPIVVSYGSSPPFEVLYASEALDEPPTAVVTGSGSCFRQIEFVGILDGTPNRDLAEIWVDFMLSPAFQEDLPLQMYVFPVNPQAELDETFVQFLEIPEETAFVSPEDIAANRERWLREWTETVLR